MHALRLALLVLLALTAPACARAGARFPDDWVGSWRGTLDVPAKSGPAEQVVMELSVAPTGDPARFGWTIVYDGAKGRQVRAYELVVRDRASGRHAIDEKNGIVLECRELQGALYSWFSIAGSNILVREELVRDAHGERIEVEFVTALDRDAVATGPNAEVRSLVPVSVQRAQLRRAAR